MKIDYAVPIDEIAFLVLAGAKFPDAVKQIMEKEGEDPALYFVPGSNFAVYYKDRDDRMYFFQKREAINLSITSEGVESA